MSKSLNVFGAAVLFVSVSFSLAFAQATTEQLVVTTYFPSPTGSYRELRAQRMAIGNAWYNADCTAGYSWTGGCTNVIDANADLVVEGNVGIGTYQPAYLLDVNGQIRTTNDFPVKPNAGGWAAVSDKRLKKNIKPLSNALDKLSKIEGVVFEWKNPELHIAGQRAGVIAQDIQKVFPDWVSRIKPEGKDKKLIPSGEDALIVSFPGDFNAYLIESIKELKSQIDALESKINKLENKLNAIE